MSSHRAVAVGAALLLFTACADRTPTSPAASSTTSAVAAVSTTTPGTGPWNRVIEGETGPGSLYAIYVPNDWNGDAVIYAHGFRDAWSPVDLRDQDNLDALRDALGAEGYAVAYSSYSENGFAIKDGAQRTHELRGLLAFALSGQPRRTYLAGHSLGAGVALSLVEQYPKQYDGALLMCGMVGGSELQTQYLGNVRALFDFFYPNALPGNAISYPAAQPVTLPQVIAAVQTNPVALFAIASTAQTPLPYVPVGSVLNLNSPAFQTMVGSLFGALNFQSRGIENILDITHGATPFGNADTQYSLGTSVVPGFLTPAVQGAIAAANGGVARFTLDQSADNYLTHNFTPSGDVRIPVLSVHNAWDPGVPAFHEAALAAKVAAAGRSGNLLQRFIPSYGHCNISTQQAVGSFNDLAGWVQSGSRPAN